MVYIKAKNYLQSAGQLHLFSALVSSHLLSPHGAQMPPDPGMGGIFMISSQLVDASEGFLWLHCGM